MTKTQEEFPSSVISNHLEKPTSVLLNNFGAGKASPGSGSAAALLSLLSAKMIVTVCEISRGKPECSKSTNEFDLVLQQIHNDIELKLRELFQKDAEDFSEVVELRKKRDKAKDKNTKSKYARESLDMLETATDYTFEIANISLRLMEHGMFIFQNGWHAVRGDSGVAISAAMSGVMSCIFIINLNLKTLKRRNYSKENMERCNELEEKLAQMQTKAFTCVTDISAESIEALQLELNEAEQGEASTASS